MAALGIVFVRHEGKIRSSVTDRPLRHPAHLCNTLTNAGACGQSSGAIPRQCREQQDQERGWWSAVDGQSDPGTACGDGPGRCCALEGGGSGELDKKTNPSLSHISDALGCYRQEIPDHPAGWLSSGLDHRISVGYLRPTALRLRVVSGFMGDVRYKPTKRMSSGRHGAMMLLFSPKGNSVWGFNGLMPDFI
jgi:hypothetical protein